VQAVDYNGVGEASDELQATVCLAPSNIGSPYYLTSTTTSITVGWSAPTYNGGCPIISYTLYRNDGAGGTTTTVVDAATIQNKPYLSQHAVTGLSPTGNTFKFKIEAENEIGSVVSEEVSIVLASVPDAPSAAPTQDLTATTES